MKLGYLVPVGVASGLALLVIACARGTNAEVASATSGAAPTTAAASAAPIAATAKPGPSAEPSDAPPSGPSGPDDAAGGGDPSAVADAEGGARGPQWKSFPGPVVKKQLDVPKVWAAVPLSDEWDVLALFLVERARAERNEQVVKRGSEELWVPNALVSPPVAGELKPGAAVLVQLYGSLSAQYGRVVKASDERVTVRSIVIQDLEEVEVDREFVVPLRDKAEFGAPVAYEDFSDRLTTGILLHPGPTTAWVLPPTGVAKGVDAAKVKPLNVTRKYPIGTKVLAENQASGGWLHPGVVKAVLHDGLQYRIAFDKGGEELRGFELVTAPW